MQTYTHRNNQNPLIIFGYHTNHLMMRSTENRL